MPNFSLVGGIEPFLHCHLRQGESIFCEANAMVMMEDNLDLQGTLQGGIMQALMRRFANDESLFQQRIEAVRGSGDCLLAPTLDGDMMILDVGAVQYTLSDGTTGHGIPNVLPEFALPWNIPNAQGEVINWNFDRIQTLLPAAFSMAVLGAIESLLCAVILDNMTDTKHRSNNELLAQGLGNIVSPFLGGITATAAIARSAANVKSGAVSPISSVVHALLVLFALLFFANALSYLPLSSMAALLLMVAWHMANVPEIIRLARRSTQNEIAVLFTCLILTVLFDMVIAISVGVLLASLLFIRTIAEMTKAIEQPAPEDLNDVLAYRISGPLFFAAADKLFADLHDKTVHTDHEIKHIVLQCDAVTVLDTGGIHALTHFVQHMLPHQQIYLCNMQFQPLRMLVKSNSVPELQKINYGSDLQDVFNKIREFEQANP